MKMIQPGSQLFVAILCALLAGCADRPSERAAARQDPGADSGSAGAPAGAQAPDTVTTASGLRYVDVVVGSGAVPANGQKAILTIHDARALGSTQPFLHGVQQRYEVGAFEVAGVNEGVAGMRAGGRRVLIVPPQLAYGSEGRGEEVPPSSVVVFDVELAEVW